MRYTGDLMDRDLIMPLRLLPFLLLPSTSLAAQPIAEFAGDLVDDFADTPTTGQMLGGAVTPASTEGTGTWRAYNFNPTIAMFYGAGTPTDMGCFDFVDNVAGVGVLLGNVDDPGPLSTVVEVRDMYGQILFTETLITSHTLPTTEWHGWRASPGESISAVCFSAPGNALSTFGDLYATVGFWELRALFFPDVDGDGLNEFEDCNDLASSCTDDCSDGDGDGHADCIDQCIDDDGDDFGDGPDRSYGSATVTVEDCTRDGTNPCAFEDEVCRGPEVCLGDDRLGDDDNDNICNDVDICPAGDDNADADGDLVPDDCDICPGGNDNSDMDGDGVPNFCDRCLLGDDNADGDNDGQPDACDPCPADNPDDVDRDGVCESVDDCDGDNRLDRDGDGAPNACDVCPFDNPDDSDGDGSCDTDDLCPGFDDTMDGDGDGQPDDCDPCPLDNPDDIDGDGVCASEDICAGGSDFVDSDGDGIPDFCDSCPVDNPNDDDSDGVCNSADVCVGEDDNADRDGDGLPNACDPCPIDAENICTPATEEGKCSCASGANGSPALLLLLIAAMRRRRP